MRRLTRGLAASRAIQVPLLVRCFNLTFHRQFPKALPLLDLVYLVSAMGYVNFWF